jgi:hypothetical protein
MVYIVLHEVLLKFYCIFCIRDILVYLGLFVFTSRSISLLFCTFICRVFNSIGMNLECNCRWGLDRRLDLLNTYTHNS